MPAHARILASKTNWHERDREHRDRARHDHDRTQVSATSMPCARDRNTTDHDLLYMARSAACPSLPPSRRSPWSLGLHCKGPVRDVRARLAEEGPVIEGQALAITAQHHVTWVRTARSSLFATSLSNMLTPRLLPEALAGIVEML